MSTHAASSKISLDCLVRDYYPYVRRLALSILDNGEPDSEQETDDAVQEIFILAARGLPGFRGEASLKTWLTTITVNHCRGRLRKRRSRLRLIQQVENAQSEKQLTNTPEDAVLSDHQRTALWAAVDRLPEKQRIPVVLHYVHDLSTAEIAASLGVPEGTVHSRLHHARRKLHAQLEALDE